MSITIDASVATQTANCYLTLAEANDILTNQNLASANDPVWQSASDDTKSLALIWATAYLDQMVDWKGYRYLLLQSLRWPRSGVFDLDGYYVMYNVIPAPIKRIVALTAYEFMRKNRTLEPGVFGQGFKDVTVGPIRLQVDATQAMPFFPPYLSTLIEAWGIIRNKGGGQALNSSRLIRT